MITWLKDGIVKPIKRFCLQVQLQLKIEPATFTEAMRDPHWRKAMQDEFNALQNQGTWTLVSPFSEERMVGCKWVFKLKRDSTGKVVRYKARLVAQGFNQKPSLDFMIPSVRS